MRSYSNWQWHLDEVFVKINGETHYLWRAVDHEGEVLENYVTKRRDRKAALKFLRKTMKLHGKVELLVTDQQRSFGATMKVIGNACKQETGRWLNNRGEIRTCHFDDESVPCSGSAACEVYRNSPPFILLSAIISTRSATSTHAAFSS